ncbi:MAG: hypothetical protein ACO1OG_05595 [Devosia sp.]
MAEQGTKPYLKLASTLVLLGIGLFSLEQFGLTRLAGPGSSTHLNGTVLSILVLAPLALVLAGVVTFIVGKMRRL